MSPLFLGPLVLAIDAVLRERAVDGVVAIVGHARLGRKLTERGHRVTPLAATGGAPLALGDGEARCVVASLGGAAAWQAQLAEWRRVVADGGVVVLIDRGPAHENAGRALCGGLTEIAQRRAGRYVVTSGVVVAG